jgi:hypothetical protein
MIEAAVLVAPFQRIGNCRDEVTGPLYAALDRSSISCCSLFVLCKLWLRWKSSMPLVRSVLAAALVVVLCASAALAFDFSRYKPRDLDDLLAEPLPSDGADIYPQIPLKITGTLVAYGAPCPTGFLKKAMLMAGIPQNAIDAVPMTRCIMLRSPKNKVVQLYIQDQVSDALSKEVPIGTDVTLYVLRLFASTERHGLLVNEFSAGNGGAAKK